MSLTDDAADRQRRALHKEQRELAAFHESRIRDLALPIAPIAQSLGLLLSVAAVLLSTSETTPRERWLVVVGAIAMWFVAAAFVRFSQQNAALRICAIYAEQHQALFGEPPTIELCGFVLPQRRAAVASPGARR